MPLSKSESQQKKKPTRQCKHKQTHIGDGDVRLINDRTNDDGTNDTDDNLIVVSPERGTRPLPEQIFDNAANFSISILSTE